MTVGRSLYAVAVLRGALAVAAGGASPGRGSASGVLLATANGGYSWAPQTVAGVWNSTVPGLLTGSQAAGTLPAFYGRNCVTGLGLRNSFFFRYEQPDLITTREEIVRNLASVKTQWTFSGTKIASPGLTAGGGVRVPPAESA